MHGCDATPKMRPCFLGTITTGVSGGTETVQLTLQVAGELALTSPSDSKQRRVPFARETVHSNVHDESERAIKIHWICQ